MFRKNISIVILLQFFTTAHIFTAAFNEENAPLYLSTYFDGLAAKSPDCLAIQDLKSNNLKRLHINFFFIDWQKKESKESHLRAFALLRIARKERDPDQRMSMKKTALDLAMNYCSFIDRGRFQGEQLALMYHGIAENLTEDELRIIADRCTQDTTANKQASRFFYQDHLFYLFKNHEELRERLMIDLIHSEVFRNLFSRHRAIKQAYDSYGFTSWEKIAQEVRMTNPLIEGAYLHKLLLLGDQEDLRDRIFNDAPAICKVESLENKILALHFLLNALTQTKKEPISEISDYFKKSINLSAYYDRSLFGEFILSLALNDREFIFSDIEKTETEWEANEQGVFRRDVFEFFLDVRLHPRLTHNIIIFLSPEDLRDEYKKLLTDPDLYILRNWVEKRYDRLLSEFNGKPDARVYEFLVFAREISQPSLQQRICAYLNPSTTQTNAS